MKKSLVNKKKKGFTLIELIIVLAVMAIIAAIAVPSYNAIKNNSAEKADKQTCETIERVALIVKTDAGLTDGTYTITPASNGGVPAVAKKTDGSDATATALQNAIDKVGKPAKETAGDGYILTITNGSPSCEVGTVSQK